LRCGRTKKRARYDRRRFRCPSDLTEEWALVEPVIPPPKRGGAKRAVNLRDIIAAALDAARRPQAVELGRRARPHP